MRELLFESEKIRILLRVANELEKVPERSIEENQASSGRG